jgi:hypothetical protein
MKIATQATFVAALALSSVAALSAFAAAPISINGWVVDSKCGATHAKSPDPDCVAKCIKEGAKPVFVDGDNKIWSIDDPNAVKNHYGHHVTVMATVNADKSSVHITKVTMLADQGK